MRIVRRSKLLYLTCYMDILSCYRLRYEIPIQIPLVGIPINSNSNQFTNFYHPTFSHFIISFHILFLHFTFYSLILHFTFYSFIPHLTFILSFYILFYFFISHFTFYYFIWHFILFEKPLFKIMFFIYTC